MLCSSKSMLLHNYARGSFSLQKIKSPEWYRKWPNPNSRSVWNTVYPTLLPGVQLRLKKSKACCDLQHNMLLVLFIVHGPMSCGNKQLTNCSFSKALTKVRKNPSFLQTCSHLSSQPSETRKTDDDLSETNIQQS